MEKCVHQGCSYLSDRPFNVKRHHYKQHKTCVHCYSNDYTQKYGIQEVDQLYLCGTNKSNGRVTKTSISGCLSRPDTQSLTIDSNASLQNIHFEQKEIYDTSNIDYNIVAGKNQFQRPADFASEIQRLKEENAILKDQTMQNLLRSSQSNQYKSTNQSNTHISSQQLTASIFRNDEDAHDFDQRKKWEKIDQLDAENIKLKDELELLRKELSDAKSPHKLCDQLVASLQRQLKDCKETETDLKEQLKQKDEHWLKMFQALYNSSKEPDFHNTVRQRLGFILDSSKQSKHNSVHDSSLSQHSQEDIEKEDDGSGFQHKHYQTIRQAAPTLKPLQQHKIKVQQASIDANIHRLMHPYYAYAKGHKFSQNEATTTLEYTAKLKPRAQRKRSCKRLMKLTPAQEAGRDIYSQDVIGKMVQLLKKEIISVEDIFKPLNDMHTTYPFEFVSPLFCDGFSLTDLVFDTMGELDSFFKERNIHIYNKQRAWTNRKDKKLQDEGHSVKKYFIRLHDENAHINQQFLANLAQAMRDLRLIAIGKGIDYTTVFLTKLDDTKDFKGCIYANDWKKSKIALQNLLGFTRCSYKSSQSCFQFIKPDGSRVKLYNKDLHLLQVTSTTKAYGLGIKPIFISRVLRERLTKCNDDCMSRIEHSNKFISVEDEQAFLLNKNTSATLNKEIDSIITAINSDPEILKLINCKINRNDLWQMLFKSIPATYVFKYRRNAVVVYAKMPLYNKYVGLSGNAVTLTTSELAAKFGIPGCKCICINITSADNYSKQEMIKKTTTMQVPMIPACKFEVLNFIQDIGVDTRVLGMIETVDPLIVEFQYVGEVEQFLSERIVSQAMIEIQTAKEIEAVYSSHKRMDIKLMQDLTEQTLINGIRGGVNGKLIFFDYNDMTKYVDQHYSVDQFQILEKLLSQEQHNLIEGLYVFSHGLKKQKVVELLEQAVIDHYCFLKRADEYKKIEIQQRNKQNAERRLKSVSPLKILETVQEKSQLIDYTDDNFNQHAQFDSVMIDEHQGHDQLNQISEILNLNVWQEKKKPIGGRSKCPTIESHTKQFLNHDIVKNGSRRGKQQWKCKVCNKCYTTVDTCKPEDDSLCKK